MRKGKKQWLKWIYEHWSKLDLRLKRNSWAYFIFTGHWYSLGEVIIFSCVLMVEPQKLQWVAWNQWSPKKSLNPLGQEAIATIIKRYEHENSSFGEERNWQFKRDMGYGKGKKRKNHAFYALRNCQRTNL